MFTGKSEKKIIVIYDRMNMIIRQVAWIQPFWLSRKKIIFIIIKWNGTKHTDTVRTRIPCGHAFMVYAFHSDNVSSIRGGKEGVLKLPPPVPFTPVSGPLIRGSFLFVLFLLWNVTQYCEIFPIFLPVPPTLGNIWLPALSPPASYSPVLPLLPPPPSTN